MLYPIELGVQRCVWAEPIEAVEQAVRRRVYRCRRQHKGILMGLARFASMDSFAKHESGAFDFETCGNTDCSP